MTLFVGALLGCGSASEPGSSGDDSSTANENANKTKSHEEELSMIVTIPYEPEDVTWREDETNKKITAVFRLSPEIAAKVVADAEKFGSPQNVTMPLESWFPVELAAQGEMSGDSTLKGLVYRADAFYMAPYTSGRVTRIEGGDYFILELTAQ